MDKLTHTIDARAWLLVDTHGFQDPEDCGICVIRDRVWATRRAEGRQEVVDVVFDGPDAAKAARWVVDQLYDAQFDKIGARLYRLLQVECGLLTAACHRAGWLSWDQED